MRLCILNSTNDLICEFSEKHVKDRLKELLQSMSFEQAWDQVCKELKDKTHRTSNG